MSIFNFKKKKADKLFDKAQALDNEGKEAEAIEKYLEVIKLDPERSSAFYNIGLIYKYHGEWEKSFEYNKKANELNPDDEAARWNLGIAATALKNWTVARQAWKAQEIDIDDGEGPIDAYLGQTPIRVFNEDGDAEVVWADRIDPARAKITNIPLVESGFRYGDLVLNDGAPVGTRIVNDIEYPVFNMLGFIEKSKFETVTAEISIENESDLDVLEELFDKTDHQYQDWTMTVRRLCKQCSEGTPHDSHDNELEKEWQPQRDLGIATLDQEGLSELFEEWQKRTNGKLLSLS